MRALLSAPQEINLGFSVNWCNGSSSVLKNVLNKNGKTNMWNKSERPL